MAFWSNTSISQITTGNAPNDGTGDDVRDAFIKVNNNFNNIATQLNQTNQDWSNANVQVQLNAGNINASNSVLGNISGVNTFNSNINLSANIVPTVNGAFDIGSPTNRIGNIWAVNQQITSVTNNSVDAGLLQVHSTIGLSNPDVGVLGNVSLAGGGYVGNSYAYFGYQSSSRNFVYKITPNNAATLGNSVVYDGVYGNVQFGSAFLSNTTNSTASTNGALVVNGGVGVGLNMYVGGTIFSAGAPVITTASQNFGNIFTSTSTTITGNLNLAANTNIFGTVGITVPNGNVVIGGNVYAHGLVGTVYGEQNISDLTVGNLRLDGTNGRSGSIIGVSYINVGGDGQFGTVHSTGQITGLGALSITGNATAANFTATQFNGNLQGTVLTVAQPNITSIGTLTSLAVAGNITGGNITTTGNVTGNYILGNGSLLTSMYGNTQVAAYTSSINNAINANVTAANAAIATINANVTAANAAIATINANIGAYQVWANANAVTQQTAITSLYTNANANTAAYLTTATGNISAGNISTGGNISGSYILGNGSLLTGLPALYGNTQMIAYLGQNSILLGGNLTVSGNIIPSANATYNLGSSTTWWNKFYGVAVQAQYADLAEIYKADDIYEPGTVVVFGGDEEITTTIEFANVSVAGVISTNPAYLMNAATDGLPVALRGRVPVKVWGPVTKGDLLVTSDHSGHAASVGKNNTMGPSVFAKALATNLADGPKVIEAVIL